jgi:hypothetical protein
MSLKRRGPVRATKPGEGETDLEDQGVDMTETGGIQEKGRKQGRRFFRFAGTETGGFRRWIDARAPDQSRNVES